ncbi:MAG: hypothetical protein IJE84_04825 [Clostridia bacterium]|nr:hypothetical protein [Clostridia bacterium]
MSKLFGQAQQGGNVYEQKYNSARMNLLIVVAFTVINLILLVTNSDTYFLFSAFVAYFITVIGMVLCGRFPMEDYSDASGLQFVFLDDSVFVVLLVISIIITLFYFLAWLMSSKNRGGWLIFALVLFSIDTLAMLFLNGIISVDTIIDVLFHVWVMYYLVVGISAYRKLKALGAQETVFAAEGAEPKGEGAALQGAEGTAAQTVDSPILREAEKDVKHKVLLECRTLNYDICYRRVKHTNELVINGNVYAEFEGLIEPAHVLEAQIDGHCIQAGFTGTHSFISLDGENVEKKLRLV